MGKGPSCVSVATLTAKLSMITAGLFLRQTEHREQCPLSQVCPQDEVHRKAARSAWPAVHLLWARSVLGGGHLFCTRSQSLVVPFDEPLLCGHSPPECTCWPVHPLRATLNWGTQECPSGHPPWHPVLCLVFHLSWKMAKPLNPCVARAQQLGSKGEKRNNPRPPPPPPGSRKRRAKSCLECQNAPAQPLSISTEA